MGIDITYNFLFSKKEKGGYNHILSIDKNGVSNPLYNKEVYIPPSIDKNRDILFQALGYIGCYANNYFDTTIHYILLPNNTIDNIQFGVKDEVIQWIESTCDEQRSKSKKPNSWKFHMVFVLEDEVIQYIKQRSIKFDENCILDLIKEL